MRTTNRLELDHVLPAAPFQERHETRLDAPLDEVWSAANAIRSDEIRLLGPLMALRTIPAKIRRGHTEGLPADRTFLETMADEGFVWLRRDEVPRDGRALALMGAAGQFWSLADSKPETYEDPEAFLAERRPGLAVTAFTLEAEADDDGTIVRTETRVGGTDDRAVARFRPYWMLIRLPSGAIRRSWLAAIRRRVS